MEYFLIATKIKLLTSMLVRDISRLQLCVKTQPEKSMLKLDALSCRPDHKEGVQKDNTDIVLITLEHISSLHIGNAVTIGTKDDYIVQILRGRNPVPTNKKDKTAQ